MADKSKTWRAHSDTELYGFIEKLEKRVRAFCDERNWTTGYFGKRVVNDHTFFDRMIATGSVQLCRVVAIERFLDEAEREDA